MLAGAVSIAAVPVAGAVGTAVHDARTKVYAEQAQTLHVVAGTASRNSAAAVPPVQRDVHRCGPLG